MKEDFDSMRNFKIGISVFTVVDFIFLRVLSYYCGLFMVHTGNLHKLRHYTAVDMHCSFSDYLATKCIKQQEIKSSRTVLCLCAYSFALLTFSKNERVSSV